MQTNVISIKQKVSLKIMHQIRETDEVVWDLVSVIPIIIGALGTVPKGWGEGTRRVENRRTN